MTYPLGLTKTLYNNFTDVKDEFLNIKQWAYDNDLGIIKPVFHAYLTTDQTLTDMGYTTIAYDTIKYEFNKTGGEYFDTANAWFQCPEGEEGYYLFIANLRWVNVTAAGSMGCWIQKDGASVIRGVFQSPAAEQTYLATPAVGIVPVSAGDRMSVQGYQDSAGSKDVDGGSDLDTFFQGYRLCRLS